MSSARDFDFKAHSRPTWRLKLMSLILDPEYRGSAPRGPLTVRGVAYNDGKAAIDSVLLSFDKGKSWQPAKLDVPKSPYAWYLWKSRTRLQPGNYEIWARATDALGRQTSSAAVSVELDSTAPSVRTVIRHDRNRMNSAATVISRMGGVNFTVLATVTRL